MLRTFIVEQIQQPDPCGFMQTDFTLGAPISSKLITARMTLKFTFSSNSDFNYCYHYVYGLLKSIWSSIVWSTRHRSHVIESTANHVKNNGLSGKAGGAHPRTVKSFLVTVRSTPYQWLGSGSWLLITLPFELPR